MTNVTKQYMTLEELQTLTEYVKAVAKLFESLQMIVADHDIYDINGELAGRIVFSGDANAYVFEYYVQDSPEDTDA